MENGVAVKPSLATAYPSAKFAAFPFEDKSGVRRGLAVGHGNWL
jgi:hypothetical protein